MKTKEKKNYLDWQPKELGNLIRDRRIALNITQKGLSQQLKIDHTYLSKLENGTANYPPTLAKVEALIIVLNLERDFALLYAGRSVDYHSGTINRYRDKIHDLLKAIELDPDFAIDVFAQSQDILA